MSEHTRTAQERAEELAKATEKYNSTDGPRVHPRVVSSLERAAFADGFLARDAEPTTITAEQIEAAERRGAVNALTEAAEALDNSTTADICNTAGVPRPSQMVSDFLTVVYWLQERANRIEGDLA